jgi:minor extracellular serine protease Vpr
VVGPALADQSLTPQNPVSATTGGGNETPTAWFVELNSPPAVKGTSAATLKSEHDAFKANAAAAGIKLTERYSFSTLWNGFSVSVPKSQVGALHAVPGVKAVYPVQPVSIGPEPISQGNPEDANSNGMIGADVAQNELGYDGAGVKIAIMDSGVDYTLPELGGCFGTGCKVAKGFDLVGDTFDSNPADSTYQPIPHPDNDPAPCDPNVADAIANQPGAGTSDAGHGTHVAGIAAADGRGHAGEVTGVAPGATIYAYRVFGCNGSTDDDTMIAAMERLLKDGAQVLNMSIGDRDDTWPDAPTAAAASNLAAAGVVVVASIGNSAADGLYSAGAPGVGRNVIGVGSVDNTFATLPAFEVGTHLYGYLVAAGAPAPPKSGAATIVTTGAKLTTNGGCAAFPAHSLDGKIALIRRGSCTFYTKAKNAQDAGAIGVVLYNNAAGFVNPTVAGSPPITIPVVSISGIDGGTLWDQITGGESNFQWTDQVAQAQVATAGLMSDFSSYGTDAELGLKPDVSAPGGQIYSTWPHQQFGGHNTISGTSMAAPHVAGAAALYLQAHPGATFSQVMTAFENTAKPVNWFGLNNPLFLEPTYREGAGLLQIADAIQATSSVTPSKLSLGEGNGGTRTLTIRNGGSSAVTYDLANVNAVGTGPNTFVPSFFVGNATAGFSSTSVTVPAGGSASVNVAITPSAALADRSLYDGFITLTPQGGGQMLRVPWVGFKGDYQSIQVLTDAGCGLPAVFQLSATGSDSCLGPGINRLGPSGGTFTLQGSDVPILLYHLNHQARKLNVQVLNADGSLVHPVFNYAAKLEYLPRNTTATSFFEFDWDGTRGQDNGNNKRKVLPNGTYRLKLSVLKALGNESNPADWETFTSPPITLARP